MKDDYKDEFKLRLNKSLIYQNLVEQCHQKDSKVITLVDEAVSYSFQRTKTIIKYMKEYTLHDGDHLFRVLHLMERLLGKKNICQLSAPESMLLILTAFFHDIGMAPDEKEVITWKMFWDENPKVEEEQMETFKNFVKYCISTPDKLDHLQSLRSTGKNTLADTLQSNIISDYIRETHAERAKEVIARDWDEKIKFRDIDLTVDFAQLCYSHNENSLVLLDMDFNLICGRDISACLPMIGVILRLADILDFDAKRTPEMLFSHLYVKHPVSIEEWNKHRAIESWRISEESIQFHAKCKHPAIESSIHKFCDLIDNELSKCNNILTLINENYQRAGSKIHLKIPFQVERKQIQTKRNIHNKPLYIYKNTHFDLSKKQVIELLMGTKLYGNPEVALRELMQNSIDACLLRKAQEDKWGNTYEPKIIVSYIEDNGHVYLEIEDNGTGMDQYIIDNYYSKIGSSFYVSKDFHKLKSESSADFNPTSRFGIGILSSFMVADSIEVETKRIYGPHKSSEPLRIRIEGQDSIFWITEGQRQKPGTKTRLELRKSENPWGTLTEDEFIESVENIVQNPPFKIEIKTTTSSKTRDENSFVEDFKDIDLSKFTWQTKENIRSIRVELNNFDLGFVGLAIVAILESNGKPVPYLELNSRDIEIDGETYTLERTIEYSQNSISESSKSITVDDEGDINEDISSSFYTRSKSSISLHGIEIPTTLFPEYWRAKKNQVQINWPLPLLLILDVCGSRDLDLNSARTEIIMSPKWTSFESTLAKEICTQISVQVDKNYWDKLVEILNDRSTNEIFLNELNKIEK